MESEISSEHFLTIFLGISPEIIKAGVLFGIRLGEIHSEKFLIRFHVILGPKWKTSEVPVHLRCFTIRSSQS